MLVVNIAYNYTNHNHKFTYARIMVTHMDACNACLWMMMMWTGSSPEAAGESQPLRQSRHRPSMEPPRCQLEHAPLDQRDEGDRVAATCPAPGVDARVAGVVKGVRRRVS